MDLSCPLKCGKHLDDQENVWNCEKISSLIPKGVFYNDLFKEPPKQIIAFKVYFKLIMLRRKMLEAERRKVIMLDKP